MLPNRLFAAEPQHILLATRALLELSTEQRTWTRLLSDLATTERAKINQTSIARFKYERPNIPALERLGTYREPITNVQPERSVPAPLPGSKRPSKEPVPILEPGELPVIALTGPSSNVQVTVRHGSGSKSGPGSAARAAGATKSKAPKRKSKASPATILSDSSDEEEQIGAATATAAASTSSSSASAPTQKKQKTSRPQAEEEEPDELQAELEALLAEPPRRRHIQPSMALLMQGGRPRGPRPMQRPPNYQEADGPAEDPVQGAEVAAGDEGQQQHQPRALGRGSVEFSRDLSIEAARLLLRFFRPRVTAY